MRAVADILGVLVNVHKNGNGWTARCPAHADSTNAALTIRQGSDGRIWLRCSKCTAKKVVDSLGLTFADLSPPAPPHPKASPEPSPFTEPSLAIVEAQRSLLVSVLLYNDPVAVDEVVRMPVSYWRDSILRGIATAIREVVESGQTPEASLVYLRAEPYGVSPLDISTLVTESHSTRHPATLASEIRIWFVAAEAHAHAAGIQSVSTIEDMRAFSSRLTSILDTAQSTITLPELPDTHIDDLLIKEFIEPPWLVDGMLRGEGTSLLVAKPKVGKSTFARCLCRAVATGTYFCGRAVEQGTALYVTFEESERDVQDHFARMPMPSGIPLYVMAFSGLEPDFWQRMFQKVEQRKPRLLVIDTLFKACRVLDANDYAPVIAAMEPIGKLAHTAGMHVMMLHHAAKGEARQGGESTLGSTAIFGNVDGAIILRRGADNGRTIETDQRQGRNMPCTVLTISEQTGLVDAGETVEECTENDLRAEILGYLGSCPEPVNETMLKTNVGGQPAEISRVLRRLTNENKVEKSGTGGRGSPFLWAIYKGYYEESKPMPATSAAYSQPPEQTEIEAPEPPPVDSGEYDPDECPF